MSTTLVQQSGTSGGYAGLLRSRLERVEWFFASSAGKTAAPPLGVHDAAVSRTDFELFVRQNEYDIFIYLWRMSGDVATAYDLSQETFLRAWQQYGKISRYTKPESWLFRVATNLAINHRTRDRRRNRNSNGSGSSEELHDTSDAIDHVVEQDDVRMVLLEIPRGLRAVLVLHDAYGFTCAEIASMLHITQAATKMRLCRGRDEFRAKYVRQED